MSNVHYRVMSGNECYGIANDEKLAQGIVTMHKTTKNGHKKETKISGMTLSVVETAGDYPPTGTVGFKMFYKAGVVCGPYK